jgi:predicted nucleic acid-binding protein
MPFVVDASVAACWIMPDERHPIANQAFARLPRDTVAAPSLWWFELRNVMIVNERRGRLDPAKSMEALRRLAALPVMFDTEVDEDALMQLARRRGLTIYDAAYLELALRLQCPLATLDVALAKAARAEKAQLIGEGEI